MRRVHLVNPSTQSFGVAVITPRWLYVLAFLARPMPELRMPGETIAPTGARA